MVHDFAETGYLTIHDTVAALVLFSRYLITRYAIRYDTKEEFNVDSKAERSA